MIPLLSPKALSDYDPSEYKVYVESLYVEPKRAAPPRVFSVRLNRKGTPVITIRRKPKFLFAEEVTQLAVEVGLPLQTIWMLLRKKKIEVRRA